MLRLAYGLLRGRVLYVSLSLVAMVIGIAMLIVGPALSQGMTARAEDVLGRQRLGAYDILVRPTGSRTSLESEYGLVAPNHLSGIAGGITYDQYEVIGTTDGVDVAAPIAMLGYQWLAFRIGLAPALPEACAMRCTWEVCHGPWVYKDVGVSYYTTPGNVMADSANAAMSAIPQERGMAYCEYGYWALVAAIDPSAEAALLGIDDSMRAAYLDGDDVVECRTRDLASGQRSYCSVPALLYLGDDTTVRLVVDSPTIVLDDCGGLGGITRQTDYAGDLVSRLYTHDRDEPVRNWLAPKELAYERSATPCEGMGDVALTVEASPTSTSSGGEGDATGRHISGQDAIGESTEVYVLWAWRGVVEGLRLESGDDGLADPLETYAPVTVVRRYDEQGDSVLPLSLESEQNPLNYLQPAPTILTTLDAARLLRGEDSISAVRVRVGDIGDLTPDALTRITDVAEDIAGQTGLDVDVVVGSSTRPVLVHIPGLGYIEQEWIQRGAGAAILRVINASRGHWALCVAGLGMLALVAGSAVLAMSHGETGRAVAVLGWRPLWAVQLALIEGLAVGMAGGCAGVVLGCSVARQLECLPASSVDWRLAIVAVPFTLAGEVWATRRTRVVLRRASNAGALPRRRHRTLGISSELGRGSRLDPVVLGVAMLSSAALSLGLSGVWNLQAVSGDTPLGAHVTRQVYPLECGAVGFVVVGVIVCTLCATRCSGAAYRRLGTTVRSAGWPVGAVRWQALRRMVVSAALGAAVGGGLAGLGCGVAARATLPTVLVASLTVVAVGAVISPWLSRRLARDGDSGA